MIDSWLSCCEKPKTKVLGHLPHFQVEHMLREEVLWATCFKPFLACLNSCLQDLQFLLSGPPHGAEEERIQQAKQKRRRAPNAAQEGEETAPR